VNAQTPSGAEIYRIALRFHTPIITGQSTEDVVRLGIFYTDIRKYSRP